MSFRKEGHMQRDKIGDPQQFIQRKPREAKVLDNLFRDGFRVMKDNAHVETGGPPRYGLPYPAKADQPERLAVNVITQVHLRSPGLEFSCTSEFVAFNDSSGRRHEESPGKIGSSFGQDSGC